MLIDSVFCCNWNQWLTKRKIFGRRKVTQASPKHSHVYVWTARSASVHRRTDFTAAHKETQTDCKMWPLLSELRSWLAPCAKAKWQSCTPSLDWLVSVSQLIRRYDEWATASQVIKSLQIRTVHMFRICYSISTEKYIKKRNANEIKRKRAFLFCSFGSAIKGGKNSNCQTWIISLLSYFFL